MFDISHEETNELPPEPISIPPAVARMVESDDYYGVFVIEPLDRGYAVTLGNPLRRVLLSSIQGAAITWVRIEGVSHEYSTIPGVKEDVVDLLLNLKAINIRSLTDRPGKLRLEVKGEGRISAGDIIASSDFEVVNPDLYLATIDSAKGQLSMEMNVETGKGYIPSSQVTGLPIGILPVDALFSPVTKVNYEVEQTRVGQRTDFERLILGIWTNGTISPMEAVRRAAKELVEHFYRLSSLSETGPVDEVKSTWLLEIPVAQFNMPVESLGLSARTYNCLKRALIHKVGEILEKRPEELLKIRNFGTRSLDELNSKLLEIGIQYPHAPQAVTSAGRPESEQEEDASDIEGKGETQQL
jgi:DNA-directed RNA polymerase subunit alpha